MRPRKLDPFGVVHDSRKLTVLNGFTVYTAKCQPRGDAEDTELPTTCIACIATREDARDEA